MVWRKRAPRKRASRRRVRRVRRVRRRKTTFGYSGLVRATRLRSFPDQMLVKLPYYSGNIGSTTTGTVGQHLIEFTAGQPFGISHEARGFNQWSTLFSRYRVVGCKAIVRYACLTANSASMVGMLYTDSQQTTLADLTDAIENHRVSRRVMQDNSGVVTISRFIRPWTSEGIRRDQWFDSTLYAGSTSSASSGYSNPVTTPSLIVFWQGMDESSTAGHNVTVELIQYVLFDLPRDLPLSS